MAIKITTVDQTAPVDQHTRKATQMAPQVETLVKAGDPTPDTNKPKGRQGFASMPEDKRKEIASKGGKSTAPEKRYFANPEHARAAGIRGGQAKSQKGKS